MITPGEMMKPWTFDRISTGGWVVSMRVPVPFLRHTVYDACRDEFWYGTAYWRCVIWFRERHILNVLEPRDVAWIRM